MEKSARWLTDKFIYLMLFALPLWTGLEGYADITRSKFLLFAALTALWLAALAVCAVKYRWRPARPGAFALWALAFMAAVCLSTLCSGRISYCLLGSARRDGAVTLLLYGAIALGVSRWGEMRERYVNLTALAAALCCLVAILQLFRVNVLGLFPEGLSFYDAGTRYTGEFLGTIGNTNLLAAWFCLVIPLLSVSALRSRGARRWLLLLPAAACLALLIVIRAESGLVGCLGCAIVVAPYYVNYTGRKRAARILICCLVALVVLGILLIYFAPPGGGTLWELSEILHGRAQDGFGSSRVAIWREALRLFWERPLTGGGPDTFGLRSALDFERYVPETGLTLTAHADNAHCELLSYLVNLGVLGLAAYAALVLTALRRWLRGSGPEYGAGLVCYLVQSLFGLGLCLVVPVAWIYMGLICSGNRGDGKCRLGEGESLRPTS